MARIRLDGGYTANLETMGEGPPVVLLHGFTGSALGWGPFAAQLAEWHTLVAVDLPGHGCSDSPAEVERYRMPVAVSDVVAAVRIAGYGRAAWLGYSMGGRTALHVAAAFPEAVSALVLIGASPGIASDEERAARLEADEELARRIEREGVEAFVDYWERIPLFQSQGRLEPEQQAAIRAGRLRCSATGLANSLRGMGAGAQEPLHRRLPAIDVPVLVLAGELDSKYVTAGREMAAALPRAKFEVIERAGHATHVEEPAQTAAAAIGFLAATSEGGLS